MMKIEEGKKYRFVVLRITELGDNEYFLLKGPDNKKYLLLKELYRNYGIKANTNILCRVDKINCQGEVFLEPQNPFYEEGGTYEFVVSGKDMRLDENRKSVPVITVNDRLGNEVSVPYSEIIGGIPESGDTIVLQISRIWKGKLISRHIDEGLAGDIVEEDKLYSFIIFDKMTGLDGKEYYMVRDYQNRHHVLPVAYYSYYGLKKDVEFRGRFVKYNKNNNTRIEPENPYYEPGNVYEFNLVSSSRKPDDNMSLITLIDKHGLKHKVVVESEFKLAKPLMMRVEKIRKGWPLLIPV